MQRRLVVLCSLVAIGVVAVVIVRGGEEPYRLRASFDVAHNVVPGLQVRVAGRPVGRIAQADTDGARALLTLEIDDERARPLPAGTVARLRYGPTAGYAVRYVELRPGPATNPPLPPGTVLAQGRTEAPVEIDDVLRVMDRRGRRATRSALRSADGALRGRGERLAGTVEAGADAADAFAQVAEQLRRSRDDLATLVVAGARTTAAVARREPALQATVGGLARTYDELAGVQPALRRTLRALPGTLGLLRTTLRDADPTIARLDRAVADLGPAARELRRTAPVLDGTLAAVRTVAPQATRALRAARRAEPSVSSLLTVAPATARDLTSVLDRASPMLACLRPYAPEAAGVLSTWSGFAMNYDANGHFARTELQVSPSIYNDVPITPAQFVGLVPDTTYAFPRAPGAGVGQPWYQPQCGATPEATDPRRDPESRP